MYIYKITNLINNKEYVGLSTYKNRENPWYYGGGLIIKKAIRKYGKNNFKKEIIHKDIVSVAILNELEKYYIQYYDTYNNGYNLTLGGEELADYNHTEETKRKISQALKGRIISKESKRKMSESTKGINNPMYGKHHTEEALLVMRQKCSHPGKKNGMYGKTHTQATLEKMHQRKLGNRYCVGRILSEETKRKMSESAKKRNTT